MTNDFEFADFSVTSHEWDQRAAGTHSAALMGPSVVAPSSDNGRSSWVGLTDNEEK
jgi:hypothetical protein